MFQINGDLDTWKKTLGRGSKGYNIFRLTRDSNWIA